MKYSQFIFALIAGTALGAVNVYAGTAGDEGVADACGTGCSYTISEDGKTLTITGTGENASVNNKAFTPTYDSNGKSVSGNNKDTRFTGIENVVVTGTISSIGENAFSHNNLTSVTILDSVTSIGYGAFALNNLTSVVIPDTVTSIEGYAFGENNLTSVTIPDSVTSIGNYAFFLNNLTSVTIPDSVTSIENFAFYANNLTSVTIPDSVTSIGERAFGANNLTSVVIPDSVTSIGGWAFADNDSLTSIEIPDSVTSIGDYAFPSSITDITISPEALARFVISSGSGSTGQVALDLTNKTINCRGELVACRDAMRGLNYADGTYTLQPALIGEEQPDGSTAYRDYQGNLVKYTGKRIYTIDEANQVAGKSHHVKIRYR